ncbi:ABC transporter permease [Kocuria palustris]|uniref:ABC transporter permease n=1 Tax=Kocuria palustris TaxID=71999 RepID=UPI0021A3521D|nr:ABC transporter permease [Kocuria palustris]MCT1834916.1 ABC transporter permease [Kocuria palustris]
MSENTDPRSADSGSTASVAAPGPRRMHYDSTQLMAVGARPPLGEYLRRLWDARHFVLYDARVRLSVSQEHTILGKVWLILNPMLLGFTFFLIFGLLLGTDRGIENFLGYLIIGLMMFLYTARSFTAGARSVSSGKNLIRGFSFPRAALPLGVVIREAMSQLYVLVAMFLFLIIAPPAEPITPLWLLIVPIFVLQTIFNWGAGMLLAPLVHRIPDVANLIQLGTRLWLYASGLFYDPSRFTDNPTILMLFHLNPLYQVLQMARGAILYAQAPPVSSWLILTAWAVGALVIGLLVFWWNEESYADEKR